MSTEITQISMHEYAQSINAVSGEIIAGPNGDFISFKHADGTKSTLPIGNRSQGMKNPSDLDVLTLPDGGKVATVNQYIGQGVESFSATTTLASDNATLLAQVAELQSKLAV
jgi:hypothetical protein